MPSRTREIPQPGGSTLTVTECQHCDGCWIVVEAVSSLRKNITMPATEAPKPNSGSSNDHARLSPSDAKRWLKCKAAIAFEKENEDRIFEMDVQSVIRLTPYLKSLPPEEVFPHEVRAMRWARDVGQGKVKAADLTPEQKTDIRRSEGSEYSREGTRAHEFATHIFAGTKTLADIPEEFRQPVGYYIEFCQALLTSPDEPFFAETKVPLFYDRESTGTRDFCIVRNDRVIINDYKHGQGELVDAVENPQCTIYGLSTIEDLEASGMYEFDPDTLVEIWIIQPRHHADLPAKQWVATLAELRAFRDEIQAAHDQIVEGRDLTFHPADDTCKWCKCKAFCPARAEALTAVLDGPDYSGFDLLADLPDIGEIEGTTTKKEFNARPAEEKVNLRLGDRAPLSDETLIAIRQNKTAMIEWIEDVCELVDNRVLAGDKFAEGKLKIVMGVQGDREWADKEAADKLLASRLKVDQRYEKKLLGPAKIEKLIDLKKETPRFRASFLDLITRSPARRAVASADDKREAVSSIIDDLPDLDMPEGMMD